MFEELYPPSSAVQSFVIARAGDRDLAFKGRRLSAVSRCVDTAPWPRRGGPASVRSCTEIVIYRTEGKKIVTHIRRWREAEDGTVVEDEHIVGTHDSPEAALFWLKRDNGKRLGGLSKQAWVDACRADPALGPSEVETID